MTLCKSIDITLGKDKIVKVMLSSLQNQQPNNSVKKLKTNTVSPDVSTDGQETFDDIVTAGSPQIMSHQQRYEFRKNRVYSEDKS